MPVAAAVVGSRRAGRRAPHVLRACLLRRFARRDSRMRRRRRTCRGRCLTAGLRSVGPSDPFTTTALRRRTTGTMWGTLIREGPDAVVLRRAPDGDDAAVFQGSASSTEFGSRCGRVIYERPGPAEIVARAVVVRATEAGGRAAAPDSLGSGMRLAAFLVPTVGVTGSARRSSTVGSPGMARGSDGVARLHPRSGVGPSSSRKGGGGGGGGGGGRADPLLVDRRGRDAPGPHRHRGSLTRAARASVAASAAAERSGCTASVTASRPGMSPWPRRRRRSRR